MSERGSCVSRYEPIPTIPEDGPLPPLPSLRPDSPPPPPPPDAPDPRLGLVDFWPRCLTPDNNLALATFERFDTLLPRANAWLRENSQMKLLKCETIERKVWALDQLEKQVSDTKTEVPHSIDVVLYVKGLRLWYTRTSSKSRKPAYAAQVGYRNATPKCIRSAPKDCSYEELGPMYVTLNEDLIERPLEGPILTMETVPIRLDRLKWDGPDVEVDRTSWPMTPKQHIFFFSRIYYLFQCPAYEQVGAADFLPDFMNEPSQKSGMPKYTGLPFVMKKFNAWLKQVKDIKVTNIQSMEAAFPGKADRIKTNTNFIQKADTMPLIRFIRVTYTRPKFGLPPGGLHIPRLITQKSFVPHILATNDNDNSPTMEDLKQASNRIRAWFKHVGNNIISMEEVYHPLPLILKRHDEGESTVLPGEWQPLLVETINRKQSMQPAPQLYLIRVFLEGQFHDPPESMVEQSLSQLEGQVECCSLL